MTVFGLVVVVFVVVVVVVVVESVVAVDEKNEDRIETGDPIRPPNNIPPHSRILVVVVEMFMMIDFFVVVVELELGALGRREKKNPRGFGLGLGLPL